MDKTNTKSGSMNTSVVSSQVPRRLFLASASGASLAAVSARAATPPQILETNGLPSADALPPVSKATFLTDIEKKGVGAAFDRLIPADDLSSGAVEAGCVVYVDRQLAGDWGHAVTRYLLGPFVPGTPEQGDQSPLTPRDMYRRGVARMNDAAKRLHGKVFAELGADDQDAMLQAMEDGKEGPEAQAFFNVLLQNVREGYFADPIYGGNKDMVGWKLVGFPGARYDYRKEIEKPGQDLGLSPISLMDRA